MALTITDFNSLVKAFVQKKKNESAGMEDLSIRLGKILDRVEASGGLYQGCNENVVLSQGTVFLFGGYATVKFTLALAFYHLSEHQAIQDQVFEDIKSNVESNDEINYETVGNMKYMEAALLESIRISPMFTRTLRMCSDDTVINDIKFKKGVRVDVPIYAMHHDKDLYDDPEEYRPERFISEGRTMSDTSFHGFGYGPRSCIAARLAMQEMKIALAKTLFNFKLLKNPEAKLVYCNGHVFANEFKPMDCIFQLRQETESL